MAENAAAKAGAAADDAQKEVSRANTELSASRDWRTRGQVRLEEALENLTASEIRIDTSLQRIDDSLSSIEDKLRTAEEQIDSVRTRTQERADVTYLAAEEFAPLIKSLSDEVAQLSNEVTSLKSGIAGVATVAPITPERPDGPANNTSLPPRLAPVVQEPYVSQVAQIQQRATELNAPVPATIFFQFAGYSSREEIKRISSGLTQRRYTMPGEERIGAAVGLHEIRYFHEEDTDKAAQAATDVNTVLDTLGYETNVTVKSLTTFTKAKPRQGVLELWLEPLLARK